MSKTRKALLTLLALALLKAPVDAFLAALLPDVSVNPMPQCIAGALVSVLLLGLPAWRMRPWRSERLPQAKSPWQGMLLATAMALLSRAAMSPVDDTWQACTGLAPEALPAPVSIPAAMGYVAALVIVPALTEEAFFRGTLLTSLMDGSRLATAALLTAFSFALMHGNLANLPSLLAISLALTVVMLHSGRLTAAVTGHLAYNLSALFYLRIPVWGSALCGTALITLAAAMLLRRTKVAHPPMKGLDGLIAGAALAALAVYLL